MKELLQALTVTLITGVVIGAGDYQGTYRLVGGHDAEQNKISIPDDYGDFLLQVQQTTDSDHYQIGIKIGNSLGASVTVTGPAAGDGTIRENIQVGLVRSTRMLPPPLLATLEKQLTNLLPAMNTIELDRGVLQFRGQVGDLKFTSTLDAMN